MSKEKGKLRVLLVSPYNEKHTGGIGTWSKSVLDQGKDVTGLDLVFFNTVPHLPKRWANGGPLRHWIIGSIDSFRLLLILFAKMIWARPDVVHYTSSASVALYKDILAIWIVKKVFRKKFVIHWHFGRISSIFAQKGREYRLLLKVCNSADISIAMDRQSYEVLRSEKIAAEYVPNPMPVLLQKEAEGFPVNSAFAARNSGEVLFVGHMLKTKGLVELIQACARCKAVKKLILVGAFFDEQLKEEYRSLAMARDHGEWLQMVGEKKREEVWEYYMKCNIFCLPSYTEGFPYSVMEAMSFACPIVATKVGAIPEMLDDGCGVVVEPRQWEPLKESIEKLLENSDVAETMGKNAHAKVLEKCSIETVFGQYRRVWESI